MINKTKEKTAQRQMEIDGRALGLAGVVAVVIITFSAHAVSVSLSQRLSQLPILGYTSSESLAESTVSGVLALPAARAFPPEGASSSSFNDIESIEQIFIPATVAEKSSDAAQQVGQFQQALIGVLSRLTVDAKSNTGAFISGRFYKYGAQVSQVVPFDGQPAKPIVLLRSHPDGVVVKCDDLELFVGKSS